MTMKIKSILELILFLPLIISCNCPQKEKSSKKSEKYIVNNTDWKDTDHHPIIAHESGISLFNGTYFWYGTNYTGNPTGRCGPDAFDHQIANGINVYSSSDLMNWKYEGIALDPPYTLKGFGKRTVHRPHVIYSKKTRKYVMWFFGFGDRYPDIMSSVAVADRPIGPFTYVGTFETGSPAITGASVVAPEQRPDGPPGCSQDLNVFADEDGKAYLCYDDGIRNIRVDELSEDYLSSTKHTVIALPAATEGHEAPEMIKYKGKYIVAGSCTFGWGPSSTYYAIADHPMGPYSPKRPLCKETKLKTWNSQITNFIYVPEGDQLIAMCDQWWIPDYSDLNKSRYLWLNVQYHQDKNEFEMIYSDTLFFKRTKDK